MTRLTFNPDNPVRREFLEHFPGYEGVVTDWFSNLIRKNRERCRTGEDLLRALDKFLSQKERWHQRERTADAIRTLRSLQDTGLLNGYANHMLHWEALSYEEKRTISKRRELASNGRPNSKHCRRAVED